MIPGIMAKVSAIPLLSEHKSRGTFSLPRNNNLTILLA